MSEQPDKFENPGENLEENFTENHGGNPSLTGKNIVQEQQTGNPENAEPERAEQNKSEVSSTDPEKEGKSENIENQIPVESESEPAESNSGEEESQPDDSPESGENNAAGGISTNDIPKGPSKDIFVVVSGRDEINVDCLDFLKRQGLKAIILNHPDEKRSLIEIFRQHSGTVFALIILTGDDFVYDRETGKPGEALLSAKSNAVFHLGYLLAKFGTMGTLAVYREQKSFRLPTGSHQLPFVPYEKGGSWEQICQSKLSQAGLV